VAQAVRAWNVRWLVQQISPLADWKRLEGFHRATMTAVSEAVPTRIVTSTHFRFARSDVVRASLAEKQLFGCFVSGETFKPSPGVSVRRDVDTGYAVRGRRND